jgi:molybdopterin converting factor small subunit
MQVTVRLSAALAQLTGNPRVQLTVPDDAKIADVTAALVQNYPAIQDRLAYAIPIVAGDHATPQSCVPAGQEIAFLMPAAGGGPDCNANTSLSTTHSYVRT